MKNKSVNQEKESKEIIRPRTYKRLSIVLGIALLIIFIYAVVQSGFYDQMTIKLVCKNQPYSVQESYTEQQPYSVCTHNNFWTGACDVWGTNYNTVTKYRTVTKYADVCLKVRTWQTPDYNTNWLNEPEIYDQNGNLLGAIK